MVIQIPNPLLLPQSYGMGEVAGMSFGSNYVIMMQIGYRYYAPRIIEEMEAGKLDNPLNTEWWGKWQKFMKTYSDQSITNTMDRTLEMPDKAIGAIFDKMKEWLGDLGETLSGSTQTSTSAAVMGPIQEVRFTPSHDREADLAKTNKLLKEAQEALQKAYDYAASPVNPKPTSKPSPTVKQSGLGTLEYNLAQVKNKNKAFVSPKQSPSIAAHQPSLAKFAKLRAPTGIIQQHNKYTEEIKALKYIQNKKTKGKGGGPWALQIAQVAKKRAKLRDKYDLSKYI